MVIFMYKYQIFETAQIFENVLLGSTVLKQVNFINLKTNPGTDKGKNNMKAADNNIFIYQASETNLPNSIYQK